MFKEPVDLVDKLALYQSYPGSLASRLAQRGGAEADELSLATFIQDIVEDDVHVDEDGRLIASDLQTYSIVWVSDRNEWIEWDQFVYENPEVKVHR
jgi:hypothetical protein